MDCEFKQVYIDAIANKQMVVFNYDHYKTKYEETFGVKFD